MSVSGTPTSSSKGSGQQAIRPTNFRYGRSRSASNPATTLSGLTDNKFNVEVNGSGPYLVTLDVSTYTNLDTGTKIAEALQKAIQGVIPSDPIYNQAFREFGVEFRDGIYSFYSGLPGDDSEVIITNAVSDNVADNLKIGVPNGGTEDFFYPKEASWIPYTEINNPEERPVPVNVVGGNINIDAGDISVDLSHEGPDPDSVQIGDGEDIAQINPDGSFNVRTEAAVTTPTIENFDASLANNEYSYTLPANSKKFCIRARGFEARVQLAYESGESDTNYFTVQRGCSYIENSVIIESGLTIYFQVDKPNTVVEILSWI